MQITAGVYISRREVGVVFAGEAERSRVKRSVVLANDVGGRRFSSERREVGKGILGWEAS